MESFIGFGGLNESKLVCFGVDGMTIFQGVKIGGHHTTNVETCSIFERCALHGTLHKTWLFKPWVLWGWYKKIENLFVGMDNFFAHNPKWHLELCKLV